MDRRIAALLAASAALTATWIAVVLAVVVRSFAGVPPDVDDAAAWWRRVALPTGVVGVAVGAVIGVAAGFVVWRRATRRSR